jgi:pilus assembly protein TadC
MPERPSPEPQAELETVVRTSSSAEILQTLEIIRLGISSGMTISDALQHAQIHSPRVASQELELVLNQFRMGFPLSRGLEEVAIANPGWRSISDTLMASLHSGSPITDQLADVEFVLQSSIDTEKLKRIKSVAVKSVLPLGLCFLPAFILLAVIPIIAGLIGEITK